VFGDVHDIGKNLVKTILANNGFTVVDLGKQVPVDKIVDAAVRENADFIGLSALLVSTSKQMPLVVQELDRRGMKLPVLIGGAAINRKFGWRNAYVEGSDKFYEGGVYYARDAFEGLDLIQALGQKEPHAKLRDKVRREATMHRNLLAAGSDAPVSLSATTDVTPSPVKPPITVRPPFWGTKVVESEQLVLREIFDCLDLTELYKLQWGVRAKTREQYQKMIADEFGQKRRELQEECIDKGWLLPKVVYGYFPCSARGNDLIIYDPADADKAQAMRRVLYTFHYPRKLEEPRYCLADYFSIDDVVAFQIVTVGGRDGRSARRVLAPPRPHRAGHRAGPGQALQRGLSGVARARRSRGRLQAPRRRSHRRDAHRGPPDGARAEHQRHRRPAPRGLLLRD